MSAMNNESKSPVWQENIEAGEAAFEAGRYAKAEMFFAAALAECEKFAADDPRRARTYNNMAALCHRQGKFRMAEDLWLRAVAIHERIYGPEHAELATNLHNLAVLYSARRRYEAAEALYKRALEIRKKTGSGDRRSTLLMLNNYSQLLRRIGRDKEAAELEASARELTSESGK